MMHSFFCERAPLNHERDGPDDGSTFQVPRIIFAYLEAVRTDSTCVACLFCRKQIDQIYRLAMSCWLGAAKLIGQGDRFLFSSNLCQNNEKVFFQ